MGLEAFVSLTYILVYYLKVQPYPFFKQMKNLKYLIKKLRFIHLSELILLLNFRNNFLDIAFFTL